MKRKLLTLSTLTLTTLSYAGLAEVKPQPFTPIIKIKNNLTTVLPQIDVMLEDKEEKNLANYLLPKIKKGKIHLENGTNIGLCGENTYVITVGINHYKNLPSLTSSISHAQKITNKIESNCQKTKSYHLKNSKGEDIYNTLKTVSKKITSKDSLVFYFSGHGARYNGKDYIAPSNAKPNAHTLKKSWISINKIGSYFDSKKIKSGLMIFDAQRDQAFKVR